MKVTQKEGYLEFYDKCSEETALEDSVQIFAMDYIRYNYPDVVAFHVNNEGKKTIGQARKDQAKGILKGVSDMIILIPEHRRKGYSFASVELKRATKKIASSVSGEQKSFLSSVNEAGGFSCVAYGKDGFLAALKEIIK